jgi:hypothetical protein
MISSLLEYENFIYSLQTQFQSIKVSTLIVKRQSNNSAQVIGELYFDKDLTLRVFEAVDFVEREISDYGYEVYHGTEKIYWYDCWPHRDNPLLASTYPHHKHIPPDIKHHRIPAPMLSFEQPNLPALIQEIEALLLTL